jgi:hypothetical protein
MMESRWLLCRVRHRSHNVECRTMPYAFWECDFGSNLLLNSASLAVLLIGIVRGLKVAQKRQQVVVWLESPDGAFTGEVFLSASSLSARFASR